MSYEVKINDRIASINLLSRENNQIIISVDDKKYKADIVLMEKGVYSIIIDGVSYNIELTENGSSKEYLVNTPFDSFETEIIDAESRYLKSRKKAEGEETNSISTPMPGKVVKVLVKEGDKVKAGETVIIISAMKMESEYKVKKDRLIKKVLVKEGEIVVGNQSLIIIE